MAAETAHRSASDRAEIEAYIASRPAVELKLARATVRRMVVVGPALAGLFWVLRGVDGLLASAIGLVIVAFYYLLSGGMLSVAARISLAAYHATALIGFFVRLALITLTMFAVAAVIDVDRFALGITVVASYLVLLSWEAVAIANLGRRREWSRA